MGVEENDDKPINLLEVQPEIPEQEPIEQVFFPRTRGCKTNRTNYRIRRSTEV
jgi:hypothetical protein